MVWRFFDIADYSKMTLISPSARSIRDVTVRTYVPILERVFEDSRLIAGKLQV